MKYSSSGGFRGGCNRPPPPPPKKNNIINCFLFIPFCIRMLKNKAQMAQESIKHPKSLRALESSRKGLRAQDVRAHTSFAPPPPPSEKSWIRHCSSVKMHDARKTFSPAQHGNDRREYDKRDGIVGAEESVGVEHPRHHVTHPVPTSYRDGSPIMTRGEGKDQPAPP